MEKGVQNKNLVSVIMGLYEKDDPAFLPESLESILNQTHGFFEFIIVADATTSSKLESIAVEFASRDARIKFFRINKECNFPEVLNFAVSKSRGDFIARMDPDDVARSERLEEQVRFLLKNPAIDIVGTFVTEIDSNSRPIFVKKLPTKNKELVKFQSYRDAFVHPSVMVRDIFFDTFGNYSESLEHKPFEDTELWCRAFSKGATGANIPKELVLFRQDDSFFSRRGNMQYAVKEFKIRSKYRKKLGLPWYLLLRQMAVAVMRTMPGSVKKIMYEWAR